MSLQLDRYMHLRASGASVELACEQSGIGAGEAELWEADIASGEVELPRARAREDEQPGEGKTMVNGTFAADELRLIVERVERLQEERKSIADDIADVFKEAKNGGFDVWAIKECIKCRKLEASELNERTGLLATYMEALGMTPIEHAIAMAA